ncbi:MULTISPECIES: hypothetical protein [Rheinheimera]|nr:MULTISPECIES: hypothetical protein [Rheinheimera]
MIIDFTSWEASDYAAWWGAIIASFALIWNVVVFLRSGARIKIVVTPNMELQPPIPGSEGQKYIFVKAVNTGSSATTITHFYGFTASSHFERFRKRINQFIINGDGSYNKLPAKLEPGEEWIGLAIQDDELLKEKLVYYGIYHNQKDKPVCKKVKFGS